MNNLLMSWKEEDKNPDMIKIELLLSKDLIILNFDNIYLEEIFIIIKSNSLSNSSTSVSLNSTLDEKEFNSWFDSACNMALGSLSIPSTSHEKIFEHKILKIPVPVPISNIEEILSLRL